MPYCPRCRWEYESVLKNCPDCGDALVEELAPPGLVARAREDLVVRVADVANEGLAAMWVNIMESHGIPCLAKTSGANIGGWGYSALLPHYLYVRESDAPRAIDLLRILAGDDPGVSIKNGPS